MNSTITTEIPILRRSAKVARRDGHLVIEHLDEEISLAGAGAALFDRMLPLLDGKSELAQIAARLEESPARVRALAEALRGAGVLSFLDPSGTMTGAEFYEIHQRYARYWLRDVYQHPLWDKITSGTASRAQVIGFAFEKYYENEANPVPRRPFDPFLD